MARPTAPAVHLEDVEILVHIAAPSRAADDARYRQLAQAYLAFQPGSQADIISSTRDRHGVDLAGEAPAAEQPQQEALGRQAPASPPCFVPESQELSFDGALGNQGSFRARDAAPPVSSPARSWHTPPSHISDSYPLPNANLVASSRAAALEICLLPYAPPQVDAPSQRQASPATRGRAGDIQAPRSSQRQASSPAAPRLGDIQVPSSIPVPDSQGRPANANDDDIDNDNTTTNNNNNNNNTRAPEIVPVTPSLLAGAPQRKRKAFAAYDQTIIERTRLSTIPSICSSDDATHISDSFPTPHRAESAPPTSKRPRPKPSPQTLIRSTSDTGPAPVNPPPLPASAVPLPPPPRELAGTPHAAADHALEIRSPSPPPGIANLSPEKLVSPKLTNLAKQLHSRFRPRWARAPPQPFERGYWLADCAGWPCDVRAGAWRFLADYLASGLAGWGVWCRRDEARGWIRLYCWGCVVEHMYLLLYVASNRELKKTGAKWYDGGGEIVLEVLPYDRRKREMEKQREEQAM